MITFLLVIFIIAVVDAVSLLKWPFRQCGKCRGLGTNKGSNRRRWGVCPRCRGSKQVQRFGARAVHRFWWSVLGSGLHEKRKEKVRKAREKSGYPEL